MYLLGWSKPGVFTGVYSKEGSPGGVRLAGIHFVNGIISILLSITV